MSTNARIGMKIGNTDMAKTIYCHWDGYIDYVGKMLFTHYNSKNKINELLENGDLSAIGPIIGKQVDFNTYNPYDENSDEKQCVFYKRDRGDEDTDAIEIRIDSLKNFETYNYLYTDDNGWLVSSPETDYKFDKLEYYL